MDTTSGHARGVPGQSNPPVDDQTLAKLAVVHQFVTEDTILEALTFQELEKRLGRSLGLGDILVSKGMISPKHLSFLHMISIFHKMREPERLFAKLAVRNRLATQEQVDKASRTQSRLFKEQQDFRSVGEILVGLGIISIRQQEALHTAVDRLRAGMSGDGTVQEKGASIAPSQKACASSVTPDDRPCAEESACSSEVVMEDDQFDILVSNDSLKAYLRVKNETMAGTSSEEIRSKLFGLGICEGIVERDLIEKYLHQKGPKNRLRVIAEGIPPKQGKPTEIRFCFDELHQNSQQADEKCVIDLKDRGRIPQVKKGDLIAELVLPYHGVNGLDVYGKVITPPKSPDQKLICGTGVEKSPDGLHFYAKIDGQPQISAYGTLSVFPELVVEEDVGFETGNISFDGKLEVRGVIQDGFRVTCDELAAREISKAHVEVNGDIIVLGGILGASIKSRGSVRAAHIHASRIEALGDVVVDKGIVESRVITSGKCLTPRGKIAFSKIIAKEGIEAAQIGSDRSVPCNLAIGFDPISERLIETLKEAVSLKEKERSVERDTITKLNDRIGRTEEKIGTLAQVQDRSFIQQRALVKEMEELKELGNQQGLEETERKHAQLEAKIENAEAELGKFLQNQHEVREKIAGHQQNMETIHKEIESIREELTALTEWATSNSKPPAIKIHNTIFSGTTIKGPFTFLVLDSDYTRVVIKECVLKDPRGEPSSVPKRVMKVYNLT